MAEDIKKQVIDWFNSPQDYDQGIDLLRKISRRGKIIGKMIRRGETRTTFEKLVYELNKVAGLKKIPVPKAKVENRIVKPDLPPLVKDKPEAPQKATKEVKENIPEKVRYNLIKKGTDIETLPAAVQRLVRENSNLYMQRGKKHAAITRLPDDNSKETMDERIELMDAIKKITERLEVLFEAWDAYEKKGVEPDAEKLWPKEGDSDNNSGSNDADLSVDELKTLKKNIQSSITKDRNLLLYGSKAKPKDGKENPMQTGPKRTKLEKRIAKKEAEIKELDQKIADLG